MAHLSSGRPRGRSIRRAITRWTLAAACLVVPMSACASADATGTSSSASSSVSSSADTHVAVACRDLPAVYAPWFSEAVTSVVVVEHLHLLPAANQGPVIGLEMGRVTPLTDALYDTVIGYSNLYMRHLSSALVMWRAETGALAAYAKDHQGRVADKQTVELVQRVRWAFDETVTAWSDFRALCTSPSPSPSRNLPTIAETQMIEQAQSYVTVVAYALPLTLPEHAMHATACDGPDGAVGDGRYRVSVQADVAVAPKHLDAIVRLASLLRVLYQITVLRETTTGTGQAELDVHDVVGGARITLASVAADVMRLTIHTRCVVPPPGQSPLAR